MAETSLSKCRTGMAFAVSITKSDLGLRTAGRVPMCSIGTPDELLKAFTKSFGETDITVDCFFGLNIQRADIDLLPLTHRAVIHTSEFFAI